MGAADVVEDEEEEEEDGDDIDLESDVDEDSAETILAQVGKKGKRNGADEEDGPTKKKSKK